MNDVKIALRQLIKAPGFTAAALLTLGLGIGACAAIFSVVSSVLLRPLPFPNPEQLVVIKETFPPTLPESTVAPGRYMAWRDQASLLKNIGALSGMSYNLTGAGRPEHLYAARVTPSLLTTLGVKPLLGRIFLPHEGAPAYQGEPDVALLSYRLWQARFGGRSDVVGQKIQMNGQSFTVVGVMPPNESVLPDRVEVFTPFHMPEAYRRNYFGQSLLVYGRLKTGVTAAQAQAELATIGEGIAQAQPQTRGWGLKVTPLTEAVLGSVRPVLLSLLGAVGFLLLIACSNVGNLLLVRATGRAREIAVRAALGASRGRILRQVLTESVLLSLLGAAIGLVIAEVGVSVLLGLAPESLPRTANVSVDARVLVFTVALAMLTGVGFGLVPALQATNVRLHDTLKQAGRGNSEGRNQHRIRAALVVGQMAIALWLLAGAGLLMRSFARLTEVNPGFDPQDAHMASVFLPRPAYVDSRQHVAFSERAMAEIAALPGVTAVAVAANIPFSELHLTLMNATTRPFTVVNRPPRTEVEVPVSSWYTVSPEYFRAMGIPILRGRAFDAGDIISSRRVTIISERLANKFFPGEDPIGRSITIGWPQPREIVGVVADVKPKRLDGDSGYQTYEPFAQQPDNDIIFVVRTAGAAAGMSAAIQAAIGRVDPLVPIYDARPIADVVGSSLARQRFAMTLFLVFSAVALVLAAIGIYGLMAYSVNQRTGEIGIRMALGARAADVMKLVLVQGGKLVGLGIAAGVCGALLLTRLIQRLLFGVHTYDPLTFTTVCLLLVGVAVAACLLPARRAARVDPMVALRRE